MTGRPDPMGRVHYNQARAVQVREPENLNLVHSAVSGTLNVYTDTRLEAKAIIDGWEEIIRAVHLKVEEILGRTGAKVE
ncbi:MAG TPA: hypothetical protein PK852_02585 [Mesotoga prima]|uniref:hypothetical protein n=1 Tax=Mesotoga prima TaxID=1184387 RepID=UPI002CA7BDD4|nr:hypothetical protein [Mesotoga prima]HPE52982.1 hypothetical protein [Mesotoga prima]